MRRFRQRLKCADFTLGKGGNAGSACLAIFQAGLSRKIIELNEKLNGRECIQPFCFGIFGQQGKLGAKQLLKFYEELGSAGTKEARKAVCNSWFKNKNYELNPNSLELEQACQDVYAGRMSDIQINNRISFWKKRIMELEKEIEDMVRKAGLFEFDAKTMLQSILECLQKSTMSTSPPTLFSTQRPFKRLVTPLFWKQKR